MKLFTSLLFIFSTLLLSAELRRRTPMTTLACDDADVHGVAQQLNQLDLGLQH